MYSTYIERQAQDVAALKRDEALVVPESFDFSQLKGLSFELQQKLTRVRPETVAQAAKIDGMTPAALMVIVAGLRSTARRAS